MVRETRHLWVGNLPENIREDRIRDHFKRYGRVQSVKILPRSKDDEGGGGASGNGSGGGSSGGGGSSSGGGGGGGSAAGGSGSTGLCATVSFMDIKSAAKAHHSEQKLDERVLTTEYHEPAAIPGSSTATAPGGGGGGGSGTTSLYGGAPTPTNTGTTTTSARFSHGGSEDLSSFDRSSHFYDRDRSEGSSGYLRRGTSGSYHVSAQDPIRSRTRDRLYRNGPFTSHIESVVSRSQSGHHRVGSGSWGYDSPSPRYNPVPTTPELSYPDERRETTPVIVHKKHSKSRSGSESGSNSGSTRSRSSSVSSQSGSSTCSSASSSPASEKSCSTHSQHGRAGVTVQSTVLSSSAAHTTSNSSPAVHSEDRRPLAICVRNLPARSSDTSLKDGLYHEYKKHGKVTWVKVVGQGVDRYALVCFKKPEDVDKALQVSHDKLFFGCKIDVAPYQGYDVEDNEFRPFEAEQDEYHPKATRTLFIGNLEKDITAQEIRKHFDQFGEIIEIDIKKQGTSSSYAFCQYTDIASVVRAMRSLDGEHLGSNRIKLGFGKSMHTPCVWVDGVAESVSEKYLSQQFCQFGPVSLVSIDRVRGHALVFYDQITFAQQAVKEMRGVTLRGRKLQVDYASRECQDAFYDHIKKQTPLTHTPFENSVPSTPQSNITTGVRGGFETPSSSSSSCGGTTSGGRYGGTSGSCGVGVSGSGNGRYGSGGSGGSGGSSGSQQSASTLSSSRTASSSASVSSSSSSYPRHTSPHTAVSAPSVVPSPSAPVRPPPARHPPAQRYDFNPDYAPDRRPYRSYEDVGSEEPSGTVATSSSTSSSIVPPTDIRHLQKERVALLELLEDCHSSGEEGGLRRRCKNRRSQSGESSRPGTPLCDERPENLPPVEPRRTPRERPPDPLSLPLPRFASQVLSPRPAPPSPPASPQRPHSSSSDSEPSPPSPEWEERLRSLDEKYEKWSGSRNSLTKLDPSTLRTRHKLLDLDPNELQPSDIVKSVLAKRSVFDEDSKRLENFGEKYEPREFIPARPSVVRGRIDIPSPLPSPIPKSPASSSPAGAKGLQYPFPSHPPVQPTTSVATTTAPTTSTVTVATTTEVKPSLTFPTNCVAPVASIQVRQFTSTIPFNPPKISPPSPIEKRECAETSPRTSVSISEKFRPVVKSAPCKVERTEVKKEITSSLLVASVKPTGKNSLCSRRDSVDDKNIDVRRKSRDETLELSKSVESVVKKDDTSDSDKVKDAQICERRKSVADKRRSSVDNKECVRKESVDSVCDKQKDTCDKKEEKERRRGSSEVTDPNCEVKQKTEFKKISHVEHSNEMLNNDLFRVAPDDKYKKSNNDSLDPKRDSENNTRHQSVEISDKKKDVFGVNSERDRRRGRDSVDNNVDNPKHRKVPETKKDVDIVSDKKEKEEDVKINDVSDKKRDKDNPDNQPINKHREKKEQYSSLEKEKRRDSIDQIKSSRISPENHDSSKHKDQQKRILESSESSRSNRKDQELELDSKKEIDQASNTNKHKESERRKNSDNSELIKEHALFKKVFGFADGLRHKESQRRDSDLSSIKSDNQDNFKHKDRREHSSDKEKRKDRELEHESSKHKNRKSPENQENTKHKELERKKVSESSERKLKKEYDIVDDHKQKENDQPDSFQVKSDKRKDSDRSKENACHFIGTDHAIDSMTPTKHHKDYDKKKESVSDESKKYDGESETLDVSNKLKESDNKKEVEIHSRDYDRRRESHSLDKILTKRENDKKRECIISDRNYDNEKYSRDNERKKDEISEIRSKDLDKRNDSSISDNIKLKHFDRHRESERKRDHDGIENCRTKDSDKKKEDSHDRHRNNEKKKDYDISEHVKQKDEKRKEDILDSIKHKESDRKRENDIYDSIKSREDKKKDHDPSDNYSRYRDYERKKDNDGQEHIRNKDLNDRNDRKKDGFEKERRRDREMDGVRFKDCIEEKKRDKEGEKEKTKRIKDFEQENKVNGDHVDYIIATSGDCRKEITYEDNDHRIDSIKKEKRKDRTNTNSWPASIGCKRRLSSQDSLDITDDPKRHKPERRDSKDSGRSSSSSKRSSGEKHVKTFTKTLEEKIKEDKEREFQRKKDDSHDNMLIDEKTIKQISRKDKRNNSDKRKEERKYKSRPRENGTASESDVGSGDDESKTNKRQHSIFDIVDDEPAYISMYDKVKARSTKNMQKLEEERRQERLKEKFNQLKQCRAKREEKKRSTSYDEDSDSERGTSKRSNKLMITSSDEEGGSESDIRMKSRKVLYDTSEDDMLTPCSKSGRISTEHDQKLKKIMSDTSEDDILRHSTPKIKSSRNTTIDSESKGRKIISDTSEDDNTRHNSSRNKTSRIQSDESEGDLGFEDTIRSDTHSTKHSTDSLAEDIFTGPPEETNHFGGSEPEQEQNQPLQSSPENFRRNSLDSSISITDHSRKKSHKKKQKKQKNFELNEDGSTKKHSSKKEKRKSSRDDEEDGKKSRKKKTERENSIKRDEKMEDIFGPLSDDSEKALGKWHVSQVYGSDSESERENARKKDKRRRERKARELDEAGRALEAKMLESTDNFVTSEETIKTKKKKRKKSRDEKIKHHQQRIEEEAVVSILPPQDLEKKTEEVPAKSAMTKSLSILLESPPPQVPQPSPPPPTQLKKLDIPGFGMNVDENIHETAVKSISESPSNTLDDSDQPKYEEKQKTEDSTPPNEEKPTPIISQEETEDAVAALLMEDAFGGGFEGYSEDTPKPDTPISEPDLQIDTDTEDTFDPIDFSRPPRTPDIPTSFYRQQDTREGLEERILALACPNDTPNKDGNKSLSPSRVPITPDLKSEKILLPDSNIRSPEMRKSPPPILDKPIPIKSPVEEIKKPVQHELTPGISKQVGEVKPSSDIGDDKSQKVTSCKSPGIEGDETYTKNEKLNKLVPANTMLITPAECNTSSTVMNCDVPTTKTVLSTRQDDKPESVVCKVKTPVTTSSNTTNAQNNDIIQVVAKPVESVLSPPTPIIHTQTVQKIERISVQQSVTLPQTVVQQPSQVSQIGTHSVPSTAICQPVPKSVESNSPPAKPTLPQITIHSNVDNCALMKPLQTVAPCQPKQQNNTKLNPPIHHLAVTYQPIKSSTQSPAHWQKSLGLVVKQTMQSGSATQTVQQMPVVPLIKPNLTPSVPNLTSVTTSVAPNQKQQLLVTPPAGPQLSPQSLTSLGPLSPQNVKTIKPIHHQPTVQTVSVVQQIRPQIPALNQPSTVIPISRPNNLHSLPHLQSTGLNEPHKTPTALHLVRNPLPPAIQNHSNQSIPHPEKVINLTPSTIPPLPPLTLKPSPVNVIKNAPHVEVSKSTVFESDEEINFSKEEEDLTKSRDIVAILNPENTSPNSLLSTNQTPKPIYKPDCGRPFSPIQKETNEVIKKAEEENALQHIEHLIKIKPVEDVKPLNAVIQDLTLRATTKAMAKQENLTPVEAVNSEDSKPIEEVVREIHQRIKASSDKKEVNQPINSVPTSTALDIQIKEEIDIDKPLITKLEDDSPDVEKTEGLAEIQEGKINIKDKNIKVEEEPKTDVKLNVSADEPLETTEIYKTDLVEEIRKEEPVTKNEVNIPCLELETDLSAKVQEKEPVAVLTQQKDTCETKELDTVKPACKSPEVINQRVSEVKEVVKETVTLVTSSRGGRWSRRRKATSRGGGVVTRRTRLSNTTPSTSSADIYEFRDESEEETGRPRLILTIKSPPEPQISQPPPQQQPPPRCPTPPAASTSTTAITTTRKSRRLQEKDGSRNTVDDTIEDVVRGTRSRRATRSTAPTLVVPPSIPETRKSPRRKQANNLSNVSVPPTPVSQQHQQLQQQQTQQQQPQPPSVPAVTQSQPPAPATTSTLPTTVPASQMPTVPASEETQVPRLHEVAPPPSLRTADVKRASPDRVHKPVLPPSVAGQPSQPSSAPTEPTTLIDPVTGLLIPMRESEEGQYIPVHSDLNRAAEGEPPEKKLRTQGLDLKARMAISRPSVVRPPPPAIVTKPLTPPSTGTPQALLSQGSATKLVVATSVPPESSIGETMVQRPLPQSAIVPLPLNKPPSSIPMNPKAHLLQAVAPNRAKSLAAPQIPISKVPTPMTPKAHILQSIGNAQAREGVIGSPAPHQGALLPGSVASPPLRAHQQPVVTGARVVVKGGPTVDGPGARMGGEGCIVVPSPSPQPRAQVMQAGLPVPAYEASLGDVQHVSYPPHHIQPAHYVHSAQIMYQQYFREATLGSPYHRPPGGGIKSECEEARVVVSSPPLELRRRSPQDRTTDSPQVATLYVHHTAPRHLYYDTPHPPPPPAHRPSQPRLQVATPPHASQVPPQADSLLMLLQRYPVMWQGLLALKNDQAAVQMHFVFGNPHVARDSLPCNSDGSTPPLRIAQRMRLEQTQVDGVARKMQMEHEHCMLLALPCGRDHMDVLQQSNNLQSGFITYLQQKQAAGIVNIAAPGSQQAAYVVHIFPACDFANESLARIAPDLLHRVADIAHLLIVIATV